MRHALALLMLMAAPTAVCYWVMVHSLISFWRRIGAALTYCITAPVLCALIFGIFSNRGRLLAQSYGANNFLILIGEMLILTDVWLFLLVTKHLPLRTFIGLPELDPKGHPTKLITEGIFSRIRHPRYAQVLVMIFSCSLIVNYPATYILFALSLAGFYLVAWLEERELANRFGQEYLEYREAVPMFIPRL